MIETVQTYIQYENDRDNTRVVYNYNDNEEQFFIDLIDYTKQMGYDDIYTAVYKSKVVFCLDYEGIVELLGSEVSDYTEKTYAFVDEDTRIIRILNLE